MNRFYTTFLLIPFFGASFATFAQHELTVNCYAHNSLYNGILLDTNYVEYGVISTNPAFYVAVFDPATCSAWGTAYNGVNSDHDFGNFNNNGAVRPRTEYFFVFEYADTNQLLGMNDMITNAIPAGFPYVIYTPVSYDYTQVSGVCPALAQTLSSRWNPMVIQDTNIMVLFGVQGLSNTFVEDTVMNIDHISFTTTICDVTGLDEMTSYAPTVYYAGDNQFEVKSAGELEIGSLHSLTGEMIPSNVSGNILTAKHTLSSGIYFVRGTLAGKEWAQKVFVY